MPPRTSVRGQGIFNIFKENKEDPWTILLAKSRDDLLFLMTINNLSCLRGQISEVKASSIFLKKIRKMFYFLKNLKIA